MDALSASFSCEMPFSILIDLMLFPSETSSGLFMRRRKLFDAYKSTAYKYHEDA